MKASRFKRSEFVRFVLSNFFIGRLKITIGFVAIIGIRRLVHILIVMGAAVDSINALVLGRNMIPFGGHFLSYFSYFFVSHFFATPIWGVTVFMTIVTEPDTFLYAPLGGSPFSRISLRGLNSVILKFYSQVIISSPSVGSSVLICSTLCKKLENSCNIASL